MKPHIEEARRALRLADRDLQAFQILKSASDAHRSIVLFHAQQAVEKFLKSVLFSRRIEFRRTHDLTELTFHLRQNGVDPPVADDCLARLNPFAVTFRYDDLDIDPMVEGEVDNWLEQIRNWTQDQLSLADVSDAADDSARE